MGLIHGDLFIDNVLYRGPTLAALLDFEQASWGRPVYDLAVSVLAFGFGRDDFRPEITRAFIDGYVDTRPLEPIEGAASATSCASPPAASPSPASPTCTCGGTRAPRPARTSAATCSACAP